MKQFEFNMFGDDLPDENGKYTSKIEAPIYAPKNKKPHPLELVDMQKTRRLINKIRSSNVTQEEKDFLIAAAQRHLVFNYSKVADYYSHASKEMQDLMERSALVIIDFEKAIEFGYAKLNDKLLQTILKEPAKK